MTEQGILERAVTLAEMAPHDSVTVSILTAEEGRFSGGVHRGPHQMRDW